MFDNCNNTKQQGNVGIGQAISYFTCLGRIVLLPLNDSQSYDLVIDEDGILKKIQVKTTSHKTPQDIFQVYLQTSGGNQSFHTTKPFDSSQIDYLFVVTSDNDQYCIPCTSFNNTGTLNLGKDRQQYRV